VLNSNNRTTTRIFP